jgi:hypothetical protein
MKTPDEIRALVARELSIITNVKRRQALELLLIAPVLRERAWDYGPIDQDFSYWCVAETPNREIEFAYCENGFGPTFPWGWLYQKDPTLGSDAQWNWYLEEAYMRSGVWKGLDAEPEAFDLSPEERLSGD